MSVSECGGLTEENREKKERDKRRKGGKGK